MAAEHMPRLCQAMAAWAGESAQDGDLQKADLLMWLNMSCCSHTMPQPV